MARLVKALLGSLRVPRLALRVLLPEKSGRSGRRPRVWTLDRDPLPFETSVPGVFAAGDVRAGSSKRVAAAVGEGSGTVALVHSYLETV